MQQTMFPDALARRLRNSSGLHLFGVYFLFALVMSALSPVLGGFAGALVLVAYVAWLQFCTGEVLGCGRVLSEKVSRLLALPVLWGWSLMVLPVLLHDPWKAAVGFEAIVPATSVAFVLSLLVVGDNIAMAVARSQISSGRKLLVYVVSLFCVIGPPAGILFLHSRAMSASRAASEPRDDARPEGPAVPGAAR